jgi:mono/diheme cytochrome c family protein
VGGLGYFGGELVYGKKSSSTQVVGMESNKVKAVYIGANLFESKCSFCHFTDSAETKVGPGLKGLFQKKRMPVSGWPVSPESFERQLKTPFARMPAFDQISNEDVLALTEYLKTL